MDQTMEEKEAAAKARQDLVKLYNGVPDDSVDLTFNYLTKTDKKSENICERMTDGQDHMPETSERTHIELPPGKLSSPSNGTEQRQRPGIPHSNICARCSSHIFMFRHRCLVCGRVYCRNCVGMGMGEMKEGRKCIECLGKRFSQRYIEKSGSSCCCLGYPSEVKQQELIWAEKGPMKSTDGKYKTSSILATGSPLMQGTSRRTHAGNSPTFIVTKSPGFYSRPNGQSFS